MVVGSKHAKNKMYFTKRATAALEIKWAKQCYIKK